MGEETTGLTPGQVLDGTYELAALIGAGGMGSVWRARHRRLPKDVAVKFLKVDDVDPELYARFRREAEIASRLGHPHIVEALDFNTMPGGSPYLVLEMLEGRSLRDELRAKGRIGLEQAVLVIQQVASALGAAAGEGIVHRDLKPENLFLCQHKGGGNEPAIHAKVLDFGISKMHSADTELTQKGAVFGTPLYMSPEQAQGKEADHRSDQYSLGVIAFEMLGGRVPFTGDKPVQLLYQVVHQEPPSLAALRPELPSGVVQAVHRAMAKRASDRFDDVGAFAAALARGAGFRFASTGLRHAEPVGHALGSTEPPRPLAPLPPDPSVAGMAATQPSSPVVDGVAPTVASSPDLDAAVAATVASSPDLDAAVAPTVASSPDVEGAVALATPAVAPAGRRGLALWLAAAVVVVGGVGVAWWALRAPGDGTPSGVAAADAHAKLLSAGDGSATETAVSRATATVDLGPGKTAVDAAGSEADSKLAPALAKPDAGRRPANKRPARVVSLTTTQRQAVSEAHKAIREGRVKHAVRLGNQLLASLPARKRWIAHDVLARAFCTEQNRAMTNAHLNNMPRVRRRPTRAFCRRYLDDL